jgi:hypothetical protein
LIELVLVFITEVKIEKGNHVEMEVTMDHVGEPVSSWIQWSGGLTEKVRQILESFEGL